MMRGQEYEEGDNNVTHSPPPLACVRELQLITAIEFVRLQNYRIIEFNYTFYKLTLHIEWKLIQL